MNDIVAVVVGIEHFEQPNWDVRGPFANALNVARLMLSIGARPNDIRMFVNENASSAPEDGKAMIRPLVDRGVRSQAPTRENINNCFALLAKNRSPNCRLFFYWSGHGFMDDAGNRILICEDFDTSAKIDRIFNATNRLRRLRGPAFASFSEQIFLADVCAKNTGQAFSTDILPTGGLSSAAQIALFATQDGGTSRSEFSRSVINWLETKVNWPDLNSAIGELTAEFRKADVSPYRLTQIDKDGERTTRHGREANLEGAVYAVISLLNTVQIPDDSLERYYQITAASVRIARLPGRFDLLSSVRDLADMSDGQATGGFSHALLSFLVRVSRDPNAGAVRRWLIAAPDSLARKLASVQKELDDEDHEKTLVIDLDCDSEGKPSLIRSFACQRSGSWIAGTSAPRRPVVNWTDVEEAVNDALDDCERNGLSISEISFVVEPPLFHHEFHRIERRGRPGEMLGEYAAVVLREQKRAYRPSKEWRECAKAVSALNPNDIALICVPAERKKVFEIIKGQKGIYYAGFPYGRGEDTVARSVLSSLVRSGAAYVFWPHRIHEGNPTWTKDVERLLKYCLEMGLKEFPNQLKLARVGGEEFGSNATMLWDDPNFNPFVKTVAPGG
jgi:hypothetical protein